MSTTGGARGALSEISGVDHFPVSRARLPTGEDEAAISAYNGEATGYLATEPGNRSREEPGVIPDRCRGFGSFGAYLESEGGMHGNTVEGNRIVFPKPNEISVESASFPAEPGRGEVLIRNRMSLVSPGTELAFYTGTHIDIENPDNSWAKYPFAPGYAAWGEVVACGEGVTGFKLGDQVLSSAHHGEYDTLTYDGENIFHTPGGVKPEQALFAHMAEISATALIHARPHIGDRVGVIGMGLVGNLAAQLFAIHGSRVVAVDMVAERLDIARRCGIDSCVAANESVPLSKQFGRNMEAGVPSIVIEATGSPGVLLDALEIVEKHGLVVLLGSPRGTVDVDTYTYIHKKGVTLKGAHASLKSYDRFPSKATIVEYVLRLIARGALVVDPLITRRARAGEAESVYRSLISHKDKTLGVIFEW